MSSTLDIGYNINTNGLSLYLDADNPNSYPGTGNVWYDLSTNSANVLTGSMTYVNAGLSSFSSSYNTGSGGPSAPRDPSISSSINFYAPNLTSVATVEMVCRFNNWNYESAGLVIIFGWPGFYWVGLSPSDGALFFNDTSALVNALPYLPNSGSSRNGSVPVFGIWYYLVFEMYNSTIGPNNILNNKMWVNGVQQNMSLAYGTPNPNANFGGGNGSIAFLPGYQATDNNINWNGINDYAMFRVYNRALSQQEITNNYNYYKPFYNLY